MAMYRVYRMKDAPRQQFRWAPHVAGAASVKAKDYEPDGEVQADGEYDAWIRLRDSERPLAVGDLLESESGQLRICKYVGFESAIWFVAEAKSAPQAPPDQPAQTVQIQEGGA
jgi:hypothetical protein